MIVYTHQSDQLAEVFQDDFDVNLGEFLDQEPLVKLNQSGDVLLF